MTTMDGAFSGFDATRVRSSVPSTETRARFSICISWIAASSVALSIHGGLFWYLTRDTTQVQEPAVQEEAAVMIDMAPEVKQAFSQTDAAVGQPMTEVAETTPPPPPQEVAKAEITPPVEESPSEAVAPLPPKPPEPVAEKVPEKPVQPQEKPKEVVHEKTPPKLKKTVEKPSHKSAADRTSGAPRSESHDDRTTATSAGVGNNSPAAASWRTQVAAAINRVKRYPLGAFGAGSPVVRVSVSATGAVTSANLLTSSGNAEFDREAVAAVYRVGSFPPPPQGATSLPLRLNFKS